MKYYYAYAVYHISVQSYLNSADKNFSVLI
jgi:hypothetical protein